MSTTFLDRRKKQQQNEKQSIATMGGSTASSRSSSTFRDRRLTQNISSGKPLQQDTDFGTWLGDVSAFSRRMASDAEKRKNTYQERGAFQSYLDSSNAEIDDLLKRAYAAKSYYTNTGDLYDSVYGRDDGASFSKSVLDAIQQNIGYLENVRKSLRTENDHWKKFETEDDYKKYVRDNDPEAIGRRLEREHKAADRTAQLAGYRSLNELLSNDPEADKRATEKFEADKAARMAEVDRLSYAGVNTPFGEEGEQERNQYGERITALEKSLSTTENAKRSAAQMQRLARLESYEDEILSRPDYDETSLRGAAIENPDYDAAQGGANIFGWRPGAKEVGNIVTFSRDNKSKIEYEQAHGGGQVGDPTYSFMTDREVGVYNYLLGSGDAAAAEQYLSDIREKINQRVGAAAVEDIENIDNNWLRGGMYGVYSVLGGVDQFISGTKGGWAMLTKGDAPPTSATAYASAGLRQKLADDGSFGTVLYDFSQTATNMAPSILLSYITSGLADALGAGAGAASVAGQIAGSTAMGLSAGGNAYAQKVREGYDKEQAQVFGILVGASEVGLERLLGGISRLGGDAVSRIGGARLATRIASIENAYLRVGAKLGVSMLSEGIEEGLQEILEPIFGALIFNEEYDGIEWENVVYSFLLGALSGGFFEGFEVIPADIAQTEAGAYSRALGENTVRQLIEIGLESDVESAAYQVARELQRRLDAGEEITSHLLGELYSENAETSMSARLRQADAVATGASVNSPVTVALNAAINDGRVSNSMAEEILSDPDALVALKTAAGLDVNVDMTISRQRNAVKEAVLRLASSNAALSSGRQATDLAGRETMRDDAIMARDIGAVTEYAKTLGNAGASVLTQMYNPYLDATAYMKDMQKYYNEGKSKPDADVSIVSVADGSAGINTAQAQAAFLAGQVDAKNAWVDSSETQAYNNGSDTAAESGVTNNGEEGQEVRVRDGSKWNDGQDTGGQAAAVADRAGENQRRNVAARPADAEVDALVLGRKVSAASQGIAHGSTAENLRLVESGDTVATRKAKSLAKQLGLRLTLFSGGNIEYRESGKVISARAYISGDRVFVRVDHPDFTSEQLMRHEAFHKLVADGNVNLKSVLRKVRSELGRKRFESLITIYEGMYRGSGLSAMDVFEEMAADAHADMNEFKRGIYKGTADEMLYSEPTEYLLRTTRKVENAKIKRRGVAGDASATSRETQAFLRKFSKVEADESLALSPTEFAVVKSNIKTGQARMTPDARSGYVWAHVENGRQYAYVFTTSKTDGSVRVYEVLDPDIDRERIDYLNERMTEYGTAAVRGNRRHAGESRSTASQRSDGSNIGRQTAQSRSIQGVDGSASAGDEGGAGGQSGRDSANDRPNGKASREIVPTFYSKMEREVENAKQDKFGASSVVAFLRGRGVKTEELKWSGIAQWLEGKKSVTKQELLDFMRGNDLQIETEVLDDRKAEYTEEETVRVSQLRQQRDEVLSRLDTLWENAFGQNPPHQVVAATQPSDVSFAIDELKRHLSAEATNIDRGIKRALDRVIENNGYFGFDSHYEIYENLRPSRNMDAAAAAEEFIRYFEMSEDDARVIREYAQAVDERREFRRRLETSFGTREIERIALEELTPINRELRKYEEGLAARERRTKTKWGEYALTGGKNYRELLFKMPGSDYTNNAMRAHWRQEGVLAHARVQDMYTDKGKVLFIEEIQSDWHNAGAKEGYGAKTRAEALRQSFSIDDYWYESPLGEQAAAILNKDGSAVGEVRLFDDGTLSVYNEFEEYIGEAKTEDEALDLFANDRDENFSDNVSFVPDAPFRDNYQEFVLKNLLRMAAEEDYDGIAWTTGKMQEERWSSEYAEGYHIEYDQQIPSFLKKYGKQWGAQLGEVQLNAHDADETVTVPFLPVTKQMHDSVLYEGQPKFSRDNDEGLNMKALQRVSGVDVVGSSTVVKNSYDSWTKPGEEQRVRKSLLAAGFDREKVDKWLGDVNSIAALIAADKGRLDFEAAENHSFVKRNKEYKRTVEASTLCAKRQIYQGTVDAISHRLGNRYLTSDECLELVNMMKEKGYEAPCGVCYVESRRRHLGKFASEWRKDYKGDYVPQLDEVTTTDGLEKLRVSHPQAYNDFINAMSLKGPSSPKVVELRTEYRGEVRKFTPSLVASLNRIGGLRVQSFSDFETPHLLDMMQVISDMSAKGLMSQAYTKVPNFAWVFGDTGMKINLSLIAEGSGIDANGKLIFSSVEGIDPDEAFRLREVYSDNVGTIIVGANKEHILACMADPRIDFIIPFHRSGWGETELALMKLTDYTDYTYGQNEHDLSKPGRKTKGVTEYPSIKGGNLYPADYWDYNLTGKQNAERYLDICAEQRRQPKFSEFLVDNGDGSYSLQPDGSTDGYWKLLIDFKMYNNYGVGVPQRAVTPDFNMTEARRILADYEGGANTLPVAQDIVDEFVSRVQSGNGSASRDINLTPEELAAMTERLRKKYGTIPAGENPSRVIVLPRRTSDDMKVSRTVRTILEASATPDIMVPDIEALAVQGEYSYKTYSDKATIADATAAIEHDGWDKALEKWNADIRSGKVSKELTAMGWALYNNAANSGNTATALDILQKMVGTQHNAAQALQATRILKKLSPEAQLYGVQRSVQSLQDELNQRYGDGKHTLKVDEELAADLLRAPDQDARDEILKEIYRDIGRQMPSRFMDKWNAWRYLSMLGNPRTHVRNIVGNAGFAPVVMTKDIVATAIESAVSRVTGGKVDRTKSLLGMGSYGRNLLKAAWSDYSNVAEAALGEGKYTEGVSANKYIDEGRIIFKRKSGKQTLLDKGLEAARKANSAALDVEDVWFSKPHYAYAMAQYCKAHGITASQIAAGKGIEKARAYAIKEAQKATYRDTNNFSSWVSSLGRTTRGKKNAVTKAASTVIEGVLPFRKTPANILARGIEYSPVGLIKALSYDAVQVAHGKMDAATMIDNAAAGITGTGLVGLGVFLAAQGLLRGAGAGGDKEKKFEKMMGHQDYALELPNGTSITLDWLAPEALPFFVGVNLWEQTNGGKENLTLSDVLDAVGNITEPVLEMSCLQSLNDLFDSVGYAKQEGLGALTNILASAVTSYITQAFPTLFGQIERITETQRETTYTEKNGFLTSDMQYTLGKISGKTPGEYRQIPYIDAWGRTESTGNVVQRAFNNLLNPAFVSEVDDNATDLALLELYRRTGNSGVLPTRADKSFKVDNVDVNLTGEEYVKYATAKGQMSRELVEALYGTAEFNALADEDKAKLVSKAYELANASAKTEVSDYKIRGKDAWMLGGESSGVSVTEALLFDLAHSMADGEKDENGKTINGSIKAETLDIAGRMMPDLTDEELQYLISQYWSK